MRLISDRLILRCVQLSWGLKFQECEVRNPLSHTRAVYSVFTITLTTLRWFFREAYSHFLQNVVKVTDIQLPLLGKRTNFENSITTPWPKNNVHILSLLCLKSIQLKTRFDTKSEGNFIPFNLALCCCQPCHLFH